MNLAAAADIAGELRRGMEPWCVQIEIAGSLRRREPNPRDIELVAIPRWEEEEVLGTLFPETRPVNLLHRWALTSGAVTWIKPGAEPGIPWEPKADGRYWRGVTVSGLKLDLFLASRDNWGLILAIRTGSAAFSQALVTHARRVGMRAEGGALWRGEERIATPTERSVFQELGLRWIEPPARHGREQIIPQRESGRESGRGRGSE